MPVRSVVIAGIAASLVIGMWEMIVEAVLPDGAGFFGPVVAIGATVVRDLQGSSNPIPFDGAAFGVGLVGHMMNSIMLAAVFGLVAAGFVHEGGRLIVAGILYGVVVWAAMWFVVLPVVDPLMLNLSGLVFLVGHLMWGAALGFLWSRVASRASHQDAGAVAT